jgi:hypothetical protein
MSQDDDFTGSSGGDNPYAIDRETRQITLALGIEAEPDTVFDPLKQMIGEGFEVDGDVATYSNDHLNVDYEITRVFSRQEYKDALETSGLCVVYMGHARYGRGACFARDHSSDPGDSWENGTDDPDNPYLYPVDGIFRLGYPYVPVELDDVEHHRYHFAPIPADEDPPPNDERHPDARRGLSRITLPEDFRELVMPAYQSESNQYWGYTSGKVNLLFHAGWSESAADPLDLGATEMRCRCFCHFGCSSRLHFREILRGAGYKEWQRADPPTDQFAYFTTATSNSRGTILWLYHWLTCNLEIDDSSWWESLKYAVDKANAALRRERLGYLIY